LHEYEIKESFHLIQDINQTKEAYLDVLVKRIIEEKITAIILENDVLAIQLINHLNQKQIAIPKQIAVVGFDNIQASSLIQPSLTTIQQNFVEIGKVACQMVLLQIEKGCQPGKYQTTEVKLITRNSSNNLKGRD
ncbi:substrate-binding domain-containing protein, partial [Acinetobacter baumannii]|uniref:substrate-binding domain-containing protein n=1 Tax=Acinetobacter baumannii TaxID=470 RepID=UPI001AECC686